MSDQIPVYRPRYPLTSWPDELDAHERSIEEQSWEKDTPVVAGAPVTPGDSLARKVARIEELHADNAADPHPSFERLERAEAGARNGDALGIGGAELVAIVLEREPRWCSWLVMLLWLIAALSLVGLVFAVVG